MLKLKKVAVTGSIASGKTTVCRLFEELGAYVVNADKIVHQLLSPETDLGKEIILLLGEGIIREGKLAREVIADSVFNDPFLLKKLEKRVHPQVQKVIEDQYQKVSILDYSLFVAEVPLLFESGQEVFYDAVIFVQADENLRKARFMQSSKYSENEFERRSRRLSQGKAKYCDFLLENSGKISELRQSVQSIFNSLTL